MARAETATADVDRNDTAPATQRNLAYQGFRQQIIDARIRPGQFVSQRELMGLLGMSLAAVREMVPRLEAAGLIRAVPKRGLQVAPVDMKLIRNAWQVRTMIEREAMLHFARTATPTVVKEQIAAHEAILERALAPKSDTSLEKDAQAVDWGLHDMMVDAIGNEILSEIYRVNSLHVRLIRFDAEALRPMQVVPAMREHLAVLQSLAEGRPDEALDRMMAHIGSSKRRVIEVMTQTGGHLPA
ncbi:GntR family transcriptional regulator [Roseomonas sp. GCM10028921]|jgi:DNA-binding GntR family transcriptional regulator